MAVSKRPWERLRLKTFARVSARQKRPVVDVLTG
jgi:hypothetical protein